MSGHRGVFWVWLQLSLTDQGGFIGPFPRCDKIGEIIEIRVFPHFFTLDLRPRVLDMCIGPLGALPIIHNSTSLPPQQLPGGDVGLPFEQQL